jgi:GT2 family glycosyltransferase
MSSAFIPDSAPDLSSDLGGIREDLRVPQPGIGRFALEGLYRFQANTGLEIELTETETLRRTILYLNPHSETFLFLPQGQYGLHYRYTGDAPHGAIALSARRLGRAEKVGLYAAKGSRLLLTPDRWASAFKSLRKRRSGTAVGISLAAPSQSAPPTDYPKRPVEHPAEVTDTPAVSIIIPTKVRYDLLNACLESLSLLQGVHYEVIIVDNGATAPAMLDLLKEAATRRDVRVVRHDIPFNFSRLCNLGAAEARHPLLLFLNDDIEALDGTWLKAMARYALRKDVGVVGARLLYASRDLQHAGVATNLVPGPGHPWRDAPESVWQNHPLLATTGEVDAVTGACLLIRSDLFQTLGGFDEVRFPITLNDVDLCLKARQAGLKVIYTPEATLLHKEGQSRSEDDHPEQQTRRNAELRAFVETWPTAARQSVFYPNHLRRNTDGGRPI